MPIEITSLERATTQLLLCGSSDTPGPIKTALAGRGFTLTGSDLSETVCGDMGAMPIHPSLVLVNVTNWGEESTEAMHFFKAKISANSSGLRLLCFSTTRQNPRFVLKLMERGARYVRIADAQMLLEAVDLALTEEALESKRIPTFRVVHKLSQGTCAPGEEVGAVEFVRLGMTFQLRLALAERLVFNLFGNHRSTAIDSAQVVSGLGDWFYRDHASNSGKRQIAKVRVPTVKVIVQRIRRAMAKAFDQAGVAFNPYDVLSAFHAEGSKRALYKLNAVVHLEHLPLHGQKQGGS